MKRLRQPPVILGLVEEHFEELDFLWEQREQVIFAPDWVPDEIAELEARAEAHLDGLRVAEQHAIDVTREALAGEEVFAAMAAALVHMQFDVDALHEAVLEAFVVGGPEARDGIRRALRHVSPGPLRTRIEALAADPDLGLAAAATDVLAFQRRPGPDAERLLEAELAHDRVLAYEALGRRRALRDEAVLRRGLADDDARVRRAAIRAAAASAHPTLESILWETIDADAPADLEALALLGLVASGDALPRIVAGLADPRRAAAACACLGALGHRDAVPALIDAAASAQDHASEAAHAFTRITGEADVWLAGEQGEGTEDDGRDEKDEDEDVAPSPDPSRMAAFWSATADRFDPAGRWQAGIDVSAVVGTPVFDALPLDVRRDCQLRACATAAAPPPDIELEALRP